MEQTTHPPCNYCFVHRKIQAVIPFTLWSLQNPNVTICTIAGRISLLMWKCKLLHNIKTNKPNAATPVSSHAPGLVTPGKECWTAQIHSQWNRFFSLILFISISALSPVSLNQVYFPNSVTKTRMQLFWTNAAKYGAPRGRAQQSPYSPDRCWWSAWLCRTPPEDGGICLQGQ